jgi:prolipoprotein diacylglyceryl transferase
VRPQLLTLHYDLALCAGLYFLFLAVAFGLAFFRGAPAPAALLASLQATLSCGLFGSKPRARPAPAGVPAPPPPAPAGGGDIFVPGALATLLGVLPALIVLRSGPFDLPVTSYPTALAAGFVAAIVASQWRAKPRGIDPAHVLDIAIICLVTGPIGSRAFFVAQFWDPYFADKPAREIVGDRLAGLAAGDVLEVATQAGKGAVRFQGDEATLEEIAARVSADLAPGAGVRARLVTLDRRGRGDEILHKVRGIALETLARGPEATLTVSGAAAAKLGLPPGVMVRGEKVPWVEALKLWNGGLVFYGGLIGATVAGLLYVRFRRYPLLLVADVIAPVIGLSLAFGRLGCTLNGCCWGREVDPSFPLAVRFPVWSHPWYQHARSVLAASWDQALDARIVTSGMDAALGSELATTGGGCHPVHPVQIYGIVLDLALFFAVLAFGRYIARRQGQTFFFFFLLYACVRFTLEHFRGDHEDLWVFLGYPFTMSQRVAILTLPLGLIGLIWTARRGDPMARPGAAFALQDKALQHLQ